MTLSLPLRLARRSLRLRLLAGMMIWVGLSLLLTGLVLAQLFRDHVDTQFRAELLRELDRLTAGFELPADGQPQPGHPEIEPRWLQPYSGRYWQVNSPSRPAVLRSRSLWDAVLKLPSDRLPDGAVHDHRLAGPAGQTLWVLERQVWVESQPGRRWQLVVAADIAPLDAQVRRFVGLMAVALAVLAAGLMLAVGFQVQVGLAPLQRLQRAVNQLRAGETLRLTEDFPAEVQPLINDFNQVLDQNARMVEQARSRAGNLAHALKTPLAVLSNAAAGDDSVLAVLVREQVETARRQVDWHLARARAVASAGAPGQRTAVCPALASLLRVMERVHAERRLQLSSSCQDGIYFAGQEPDLLEMLGNLLDNACKWARCHVTVTVSRAGMQLEIRVEDDGPGLPAPIREAVLQRGVRADEQVPGSGLGLSIVDELARLHGGSIRLEASALGGVAAVLVIPAVPE